MASGEICLAATVLANLKGGAAEMQQQQQQQELTVSSCGGSPSDSVAFSFRPTPAIRQSLEPWNQGDDCGGGEGEGVQIGSSTQLDTVDVHLGKRKRPIKECPSLQNDVPAPNDIEPGLGTKREMKWNRNLGKLSLFKAKNGHTNVGRDDNQLYQWLLRQKEKLLRAAEGGKSGLNEEQIALLKNMGVVPLSSDSRKFSRSSDSSDDGTDQTTTDKKWYKKLDDLKKYKKAHGTARVKPGVSSLYNWTHRMRGQLTLYQQNKPSTLKPQWARDLAEVLLED